MVLRSSYPPLYGGWVTPPPGRGRHQPACSSYPPLYGGWVTPPPGRGRHLPTGLVNIMRAVRLSHVQSFVTLVWLVGYALKSLRSLKSRSQVSHVSQVLIGFVVLLGLYGLSFSSMYKAHRGHSRIAEVVWHGQAAASGWPACCRGDAGAGMRAGRLRPAAVAA